MRGAVAVFALTVGFVLGCGGGGGGSALTPSAPLGPFAASVVTYAEKEQPGLPCPGYHLGDSFAWGDFTVRFDEALVATPWTGSPVGPEERVDLSRPGMKVLLLLYSVRNDSPVRQPMGMWTYLRTPDGETNYWYQGNRELFRKSRGIPEPEDPVPPGKWVQFAAAAGVREGATDGAAMYLTWEETRYDPTDPSGRRTMDVVSRHAVVDLGNPPDGGAVEPVRE